jgi:hypothetical protein
VDHTRTGASDKEGEFVATADVFLEGVDRLVREEGTVTGLSVTGAIPDRPDDH